MVDVPSHHRSATHRGSGHLLIALAIAAVVGIYLLGKTSPRLSFNPVGADWFGEWLVWLFAAVLFGLMLLGPARSRTTPRRRLALVALRLAVIVLVILMMLRPVLVYWATHQRPAQVSLLLDVSGSMKAADDRGQSRYERLKEVLQRSERALAGLAEDLELKFYAFDSELRELKFSDGRVELPDAPEGEQTAIGHGIGEALKRAAGKRLAAMIVMGDGAQRALAPRDDDPRLVARRMKGRKQPIYTVVFGQTEAQVQQRDVVLATLQSNQSVHVKNNLPIKGEAQLFGFANQKIAAHVEWETAPGKMEIVSTKQVPTGASGTLAPFAMTYAPETPGLFKMVLRLDERPGELDTENNQQATIVRVIKGGLRVLYLESTVRLETRNLLRSLGSAPNIEVDYLRLPMPQRLGEKPPPRSAVAEQVMAEAFQPGKYDVVMLGNLPASAFLTGPKPEDGELYKLREHIRRGAGLIMLGGIFSFGPGDYAKTPMEDLLPVTMRDDERQDPGTKLRTDRHHLGPVHLRPSPKAAGNYLTLLTTPERNAQAWSELPPLLNGANQLDPKGGNILLEDAKGNAMLVAGQYGSGRVLAFAGDSTWRWVSHGKEEQHKRFWRQLILWLGRKDQEEGGRVWVDAKQRNVFVGQRVELAAGARTPTGEPLEDFDLRATVIRRDDTFKELSRDKLQFNRQGDRRTVSLKTSQPGDYTIEVQAFQNGQLLGMATERFLVRAARQLEMQRPVPDPATMQQLADLTGGQRVSPAEFSQVLDRLAEIPAQLTEQTRTVSSLWDPMRAGPFALFGLPVSLAGFFGFAVAALLGLEWYLRKKWGLV